MQKSVVLNLPKVSTPVELKEVNGDLYYGVQVTGRSRGYVTATNFEKDFGIRSAQALTIGNRWPDAQYNNADTLKNLIEKCLNANLAVFQFDMFIELAQWLSEKQ